MTSELTEFYTQVAPQCRQLEKKGSYWHLTWTCKLTGCPCGPKECPDRPDLKDLIKASESEPVQQGGELAVETSVRLLESGISGTLGSASLLADVVSSELSTNTGRLPEAPSPASTPNLKPTSETLPKIGPQVQMSLPAQTENVSLHSKVHSRPHVIAGSVVKRALITFLSRTGQTQRWGFDCIFSSHIRKPAIIEFKAKRAKDARFYFTLGTDNETVKTVITSWFEKLEMGSPGSYVTAEVE